MKKAVLLAFVLVFLSTALFVCAIGMVGVQVTHASPYTNVNVETAYDMITNGSYPDLLVLDVRTKSEYDDGHIYGSVLIPHTELEARISELSGHENHEIIVYCRTGVRSITASEILDSHNFTKVFNMLGGIQAWESASHPVWISIVHNLNTTLNYDTIQAAIDAPQTLNGHTIFVDAGTYYEHVVVNKSISLIGEDRDNTIINETYYFIPSIEVEADSVTITGFTLQGWATENIYIKASTNVTVKGNRILFIGAGIKLDNSNNNIVIDNIIEGYGLDNIGIIVVESSGCIIENNTISGAVYAGIRLIWSADTNIIRSNTISNNDYGIHLIESSNNSIYHNSFVNNTAQTYVTAGYVNTWDNGYPSGGNYWSDYEERYPNATEINGSGIMDTPYVIDENNQDNYPIVPEFPTWTSMLLILTLLTVAIAFYKRRLLRTLIH